MLKKTRIVAGLAAVSLVVLFLIAGRQLSELRGYVQATADKTVDDLADKLPDDVRDRKMAQDLKLARQELIDRQVQLNLSNTQIEQLRNDVKQLDASVKRRKRLLAEAYPVMKRAVDLNESTVCFASASFSMADFQREIDELMRIQDRETRKLKIKQEGLARLETTLRDGERILGEMRGAMENKEQEVAVLKTRREHAKIEAATLDMITSVTANHESATTGLSEGVNRMKKQVQELEARNEARRFHASTESGATGELDRTWSRMELLKQHHDDFTGGSAESQKSVNATDLVINIRPEGKGVGSPNDE